MEKQEISIYGERLRQSISTWAVFCILAVMGLGVPLYLLLAEDFTLLNSVLTVLLLMVLLALWAWYNEQDVVILSDEKIIFKKRWLTNRFRLLRSIHAPAVSSMRVTRIVNPRMAPKTLFTIVHHNGLETEQWAGLVLDKIQEEALRSWLATRGIPVLFEE